MGSDLLICYQICLSQILDAASAVTYLVSVMTTFKPPKQYKLSKVETLASFEAWKHNQLYNLQANPVFKGELRSFLYLYIRKYSEKLDEQKKSHLKSNLCSRVMGF